ncbi:putative endonuclease-reverse transcriptase [Trichonephila clavipes]|nr:putative endonuclease-reverse transcriptase [Trichonephila clavipes]
MALSGSLPQINLGVQVRRGDPVQVLSSPLDQGLVLRAIEKVSRDSNINTRGNILNKSIQLLAFADDIDIIARTPTALMQAFLSLEKDAFRMGLRIDKNKTKYIPCA